MAKIIAICNQKGGTGKTTTAVNLSIAIALAGKRVLLVDIDPQANATSGLGLDKNKIAHSVYDVLIEETPIQGIIMSNLPKEMSNLEGKMSNLPKEMSNLEGKMSNLPKEMSNLPKEMSNLPKEMSNLEGKMSNLPKEMSNLEGKMSNLEGKMSILPSNFHLAGAEVELVSILSREHRLRKALEAIKTEFDFIFIDCPPSLGLLTINGLSAATSVIIPVQCEYYALEGLTQLLNTITLVRDNLNLALEIEGVLLTMADYRTNLTQEVINEVRSYFKAKAYQTVIPRNIRLSEAPSFGKSIFTYDKDSIGAKKYWELACEILGMNSMQPIENNRVINIETPQGNRVTKVEEQLRSAETADTSASLSVNLERSQRVDSEGIV